jgi:GTP-binding protein YchF
MGLKCGIIGMTNSGKTTLFNCMSNFKGEISNYAFSNQKSNFGIAKVPDVRLEELHKLVKAEQLVHATIDLIDIPGLVKGSSQGGGIGNSFLADVRLADALIHIVRCFEDENLPHIEGAVDPVRDKEIIDLELQVKDVDQIDRKIIKVEKAMKVGEKFAKQHYESLTKMKNALEDFTNIRDIELDDVDREIVSELFLLTAKPVIYVCNVDEKSIQGTNRHVERFIESVEKEHTKVLVIAGSIEADIATFEDIEERTMFLQDLGLEEPGVNKLAIAAYDLLNLISFFTVGGKENRAWTIRKGTRAQQAAGTIHSDLERGFIRAEVISYNDYITYKSEQACKEHGKLRLEGKQYIVQDGDIMHIRFNV